MRIIAPKRGPLRVLIYARYSTDEQNPRSIADQIAYCNRFVGEVYGGPIQMTTLHDDGLSGELVSRPGIDRVKAGIKSSKWDLIIAEDASRLYRNETAGFELVGNAVDEHIRVICINEHIDTAEEDEWEERLHQALRHHAQTNRYTSLRIKRALEALWLGGFAVGMLRPGYFRSATTPATVRDPAGGPFRDQIDPQWTGVIQELFTRVANNDPLWHIVPWLEQTGLPKLANASKAWNERNVISLIRRTLYRGLEEYRVTISKKKHRTGKRKPARNEPQDVLVRQMPHLRIVSDQLWLDANRAIDARASRPNPPTGKDHPLHEIPRDSRGPLSGILVCGICGAKMYACGRNDSGYKCAGAVKGRCWNKATTLKSVAHPRIAGAVLDQLPAIEARLEELVGGVRGLLTDDPSRQARRGELQIRQADLKQAIQRIMDAIEASDDAPEVLLHRLANRNSELGDIEAELDQVEAEVVSVPTSAQLAMSLQQFSNTVGLMGREARPELSKVVSAIRAIPYQQYGSSKVVLKARFDIELSGFLPYAVLSLLRNLYPDGLAERLGTVPITVDLFEMSASPKYAWHAFEIYERSGRSLIAAERQLGINKPNVYRAVTYARMLREAGLVDPFIELAAPPANPGRWRYREQRTFRVA